MAVVELSTDGSIIGGVGAPVDDSIDTTGGTLVSTVVVAVVERFTRRRNKVSHQ